MKLEYKNLENKYQTIKEVAKKHFHISDRLLLKLKKNHQIFINGKPAEPYAPINSNDIITLDISFSEKSENIVPTEMQLDIIYEDEGFLIINKQPNLPVHPSIAHFEDSLSNGIAYYFEQNHIHTKIRPVNRLDKDTSGIVIFAKNEYIQDNLTHQMTNHLFQKKYLALLEGNLETEEGIIKAPIARREREYHRT